MSRVIRKSQGDKITEFKIPKIFFAVFFVAVVLKSCIICYIIQAENKWNIGRIQQDFVIHCHFSFPKSSICYFLTHWGLKTSLLKISLLVQESTWEKNWYLQKLCKTRISVRMESFLLIMNYKTHRKKAKSLPIHIVNIFHYEQFKLQ